MNILKMFRKNTKKESICTHFQMFNLERKMNVDKIILMRGKKIQFSGKFDNVYLHKGDTFQIILTNQWVKK